MKPKIFFIIAAIAAWAFLGTNQALAQTPKPLPIVPATVVANFIGDETVYQCGGDIVFFRVGEGPEFAVATNIFVLSNDPVGRPLKVFYYDGRRAGLYASVTASLPGVREPVSVFTETGWWHTYAFRKEFRATVSPAITTLVTVVVLLRQKTQECLLTKQVNITGAKG